MDTADLYQLPSHHPLFEKFILPIQGHAELLVTRHGKIRAYSAGNSQKTLLVMPGYTEMIEKFAPFVQYFVKDYRVILFDPIGQAGSERMDVNSHKIHIDDFYVHQDVLHDVTEHYNCKFEDTILVGNSMGGHVVLDFVLQNKGVRGFILLNPMLSFDTAPWPKRVAKTFANWAKTIGWGHRYAPGKRDWRYEDAISTVSSLSGDPLRAEVHAQFEMAHPSLRSGGATFGWVDAAFRSCEKLQQTLREHTVKTSGLVLLSEKDRLVDPKQTLQLLKQHASIDIHLVKNAGHELLMETDPVRARLFHLMDNFLLNVAQN